MTPNNQTHCPYGYVLPDRCSINNRFEYEYMEPCQCETDEPMYEFLSTEKDKDNGETN